MVLYPVFVTIKLQVTSNDACIIGHKNWFNKTKFNPGNKCTGDSDLNKCQIPGHLELKSLAVAGEGRGEG